MKVSINRLKEGYKIREDIMGLTKNPIVKKGTTINQEIIDVLQAFLIEEVNVDIGFHSKTKDAVIEQNNDKVEKPKPNNIQSKDEFMGLYFKSVQAYKKEFLKWQSGLPIEINKIRKIIIPLIEQLELEPKKILLLQNYADEKNYLFHHSIAMGIISGYIAKKMKLTKGDCIQMALGGCLSDCGLAKIDSLQLDKFYKGNDKNIKDHPAISYKMLQNIASLKSEIKIAVFQHHERLDGSGFPLNVKDNKIHLYAKIIAVADIYHEMACNINSEALQSPFNILESLRYNMFGKFDISIVQALQTVITDLSINATVKLSNGQIGNILFFDSKYPTKPIVKINDTDQVISLMQEKEIQIGEIISTS